ncbi:MAG: AAA family ATPase, partial [Lachnospiraceae bacterium]|nr:AAA family ATPase [Lachnospiraceae bacterium]
ALAAKAKLLLFDEPTSGLDFAHMVKVGNLLEKIAKEGRTVLVSTHDPELIAMCCDYVLSIENGQVSSLKKVENKLQWKQ